MFTSILGLTLTLGLAAGAPEKLVVLDLQAAGGVPNDVAAAITEAMAEEVGRRGFFEVMVASEVRTLIGLERERQLLGCSEQESSCFAEIAGAMGARFVLSGTLALLGSAYQLTLQTIDSTRAQPLGRSVRLAGDLETLRLQLAAAVAEATATPLPPPPVRTLQWSLIGAGGLAMVGSGLIGLDALGREREVHTELRLGADGALMPGTFAEYQQRAGDIDRQKLLSTAGLVVGAGLTAAGLLLLPELGIAKDRVAIVPGHGGVSLVGVWP